MLNNNILIMPKRNSLKKSRNIASCVFRYTAKKQEI